MGLRVHLHVRPANRATGWEVKTMTAIVKLVLIVILAVGALGLIGCKRHRFRHVRGCPCCRIDVVDHDRYDRGVDVHVYRSRRIDRHEDHHRRRH